MEESGILGTWVSAHRSCRLVSGVGHLLPVVLSGTQQGAVLSHPGVSGESPERNADPRARAGRPVPLGCQGRARRKGSGHPEECGRVSTYCRPRGNPRPAGSRDLRLLGGQNCPGQQGLRGSPKTSAAGHGKGKGLRLLGRVRSHSSPSKLSYEFMDERTWPALSPSASTRWCRCPGAHLRLGVGSPSAPTLDTGVGQPAR